MNRRVRVPGALAVGIASAALVVGGVTLAILAVPEHPPGLDQAEAQLLERVAEIERVAAPDYQRQALARIPASERHGAFVYLRDLQPQIEATAAPRSPEPASEAAEGFALEFDGTDAALLLPGRKGGNELQLDRGLLRLTGRTRNPVVLDQTVEIGREDIGEIWIRMRSELGTQLFIGWDASIEKPMKHRIGVDLIPGGEFHEYRIPATLALREGRVPGGPLGRIAIQPSNAKGDTVEIDFLRFVPRSRRYAGAPSGSVHETLSGVTRPAIYTLPGYRVSYEVEIPAAEPSLSFAVGMLRQDGKATYSVSLDDGEQTLVAWQQVLAGSDAWTDAVVDLAPWAGKRVQISLSVEGSRGNVGFWGEPRIGSRPLEPLQIIMILEDTTRADHLSTFGYERETSPFHSELAARGAAFEHAFTQATKTRPSVPSLMTSLLPSATGVWSWADQLASNYLTLAEVLRAQGFRTASFVQNHNAGTSAGLHQGYEILANPEVMGARPEALHGAPVLSWLERHRDESFFLYLHILDPHAAYDPGAEHDIFRDGGIDAGEPLEPQAKFDPDEPALATKEGRRARYDGEIRRNDDALRQLFTHLEELGIAAGAIVVLLSDHGEYLGERGIWGHKPPGFSQVTHVPLLISLPGRVPAGLRIRQPVQIADVMPTVLELAGIDAHSLAFFGQSLVPLFGEAGERALGDRLLVSEEPMAQKQKHPSGTGSLFYQQWHLLHSQDLTRWEIDGSGYRVFDLYADPQEIDPWNRRTMDRSLGRRSAATLRAVQESGINAWRAFTREADGVTELDPAAQEQLRALGYIE